METSENQLLRSLNSVLAAAEVLPRKEELSVEIAAVERAQERGWFTPDEDELVRGRYSAYLAARNALREVLEQTRSMTGHDNEAWSRQLHCFLVAFTAAALLVRGTSFIISLAKKRPVIWKKLDEPEMRFGLPKKTFTDLHRAVTSPLEMLLYRKAVDFYRNHREEIQLLENHPQYGPLVTILRDEEEFMELSRRDIWIRRLFYRWYSILRSHRSGYRKVMFHLFRLSGSAIAELKQPGVKLPGAAKRLSSEQREALLNLARPGDVFITRHDDAMSNLFLPGYWPHAALYLGSVTDELSPLSPEKHDSPKPMFLEAKKDGVRVRNAEETLHVDSCLILRPPLPETELRETLLRALTHEGKLYDFLFDFRTSDRLACTEVVYRCYHGVGEISFQLVMKSGRACIPAEDLIDQALAAGFSLVAVCNYQPHTIHCGEEAQADLIHSRKQMRDENKSPIANPAP